jgi:hypothetical protein
MSGYVTMKSQHGLVLKSHSEWKTGSQLGEQESEARAHVREKSRVKSPTHIFNGMVKPLYR